MNTRVWSLCAGTVGLAALLTAQGPARQQQPPPAPPEGVSVLTRGPVHEAYAEPSETQPQASPLVPQPPPEPVEETPPEQMPEGNNVQWIPGYWQWEGDTQDYLWVSGFWRDVPPGRRWVPGVWQAVEGGWHWVAGYWAEDTQAGTEYLPAPPPTLDTGPSTPAPDATSTYVPGCWVYRETRFFWRPGYWVAFRPDWCWVPDRYVWTPGGCIFVAGYWDHPLHERGLLFAPVRFARAVLREGFRYAPQLVVQPDFLLWALFVRRVNCHYYFGDYFEASYEREGFTPWVDYRVVRGVYDPNFSWYHRRYAEDRQWEANLRELYAGRRSGAVPRPPRTLVQQQEMIRNITVNKTQNVNVIKNINVTNIQNVTALTPLRQAQGLRVTALAEFARAPGAEARPAVKSLAVKLEAVTREQQAQHAKAAEQLRQAAVQRREQEARVLREGKAPVKPTDPPHRVQLDLPKPVSAAPARPALKAPPPPPPAAPKHEDRPIPPHEPAKPVRPPAPAPHPAPPPPVLHLTAPVPHPAPPPPRLAAPAPHPAPPPPHPAPPPKRPGEGKGP